METHSRNQARLYSPLALAFCLSLVLSICGGCHKDQSGSGGPTSSSTLDGSDLELITNTEEKERENLESEVRSLIFKGEFARLESMAKEFREQESRFRNGMWKLRIFYIALGNYPEDAPESEWQNLIKQGENWVKAYPESVTPRIALAEIYRGYAWVARTSQTADKVTERGWQVMGQRLQKAFQSLQEASKLKQKCPGWYGTAQRVSLGAQLDRQKYEALFQKGLKAAPTYTAIYEYKAYYLLPRWYGNEGEWETFAMDMMKRTDIPDSKEIFARIAIYFRNMGLFYDEFSGSDESWDALKESFHAMETNHPDSLETKSILCLISAKVCDYKEAREQMKLIGNQVDLSVWTDRTNFLGAVNWLKNSDAELEKCRQQWKQSRRK